MISNAINSVTAAAGGLGSTVANKVSWLVTGSKNFAVSVVDMTKPVWSIASKAFAAVGGLFSAAKGVVNAVPGKYKVACAALALTAAVAAVAYKKFCPLANKQAAPPAAPATVAAAPQTEAAPVVAQEPVSTPA